MSGCEIRVLANGKLYDVIIKVGEGSAVSQFCLVDTKPHQAIEPVTQLTRGMAEQLMEDLWVAGIRPQQMQAINRQIGDMQAELAAAKRNAIAPPTDESTLKAVISAQGHHLADLRDISFALLEYFGAAIDPETGHSAGRCNGSAVSGVGVGSGDSA